MKGENIRKQLIYRKMENGMKYCADESIVSVSFVGLKDLLKEDVSELTTLECLLLWLQYSHCEEHQELMKAIRKKERGINQLEKSMQHAIRADYGSIKQIVDQ